MATTTQDRRRRRYLAAITAVLAVVMVLVARGCFATASDEGSRRTVPEGAAPHGVDVDDAPAPSERNAVDAGIAFATAPQRWLYMSDEEVDEAVRALAAPHRGDDMAAAAVEDVREAREGLSASSGPVWWLVRPLAVKVEGLTDDRATVEVWAVTVLSAREVAAPQAEWRTIDLDLVWAEDAWKVDAVRDTPGPTPMVGPGDRPWDAVPFDAGLEGFERLDGEAVR